MSYGQDGLMEDGYIVNDFIFDVFCKQLIVQVCVGCNVIVLSDMMDGCIGCICQVFDEEGFVDEVCIFVYLVKYVFVFYGLFCDVVGLKGNFGFGDKCIYQMDLVNSDEVICEVVFDIEEGVDMVMVKLGMFYFDICCWVKEIFGVLMFVYQVSGEYVMFYVVVQNGWFDGDKVMLEVLFVFKCVGCDGILIYVVVDIVKKFVQ